MSDLLLLQSRREPADTIGVDREKKALLGFVVARAGEARGHGFDLDEVTLNQIVEMGNAVSGGVKLSDKGGPVDGLKMRFTHPGKFGDPLGTHLGRVRNFRREGDVVRADGYFSRTAHSSPKYGDMATYLMDLAEDDPEAFAASVAIKHSLETAKGSRPKLRISKLAAIDFVGDAAAADAVFSSSPESPCPEEGVAMSEPQKVEPSPVTTPVVPAKEPETKVDLSANQEAEKALRAIAQETEQLRCEGIANLCVGLSCPELIPGMIGDKVNLAAAREKAKAYLAAKQPPLPSGTAPETEPKKTDDPGQKWRDEYKANEAYLSSQGLSEEGYVSSCLRSEKGGVISLVPVTGKAG